MPSRAELVERFAASDIDALNDVVASDDFTDEAKEVAREQLLARGIAGPAMRGAGHVSAPRRKPRKSPLLGSPAGIVTFWVATRGLMAILLGLPVFFFGAMRGASGIDSIAAGVGLCAAGAMMVWRRAALRWVGIASFVCAYGMVLWSAHTGESDEGWYHAIRWLPAAVLSVTTLLLIRTQAELAADTQ